MNLREASSRSRICATVRGPLFWMSARMRSTISSSVWRVVEQAGGDLDHAPCGDQRVDQLRRNAQLGFELGAIGRRHAGLAQDVEQLADLALLLGRELHGVVCQTHEWPVFGHHALDLQPLQLAHEQPRFGAQTRAQLFLGQTASQRVAA